MSTPAHPPQPSYPGSAVQAAPSLMDWLFGALWPDRLPGRPRLLAAALGAGALAAVVVPDRSPGLGLFVVFVAVAAVVASADERLRSPGRLAALVLCLLLGSVVVLRDAEWVAALCVLAAVGMAAAALVGAHTFTRVAVAAVAVPTACLRSLPWIGRSVAARRSATSSWAVARTLLLSIVLASIFGGLFASADAVFSSWADAVVPDLTLDTLGARLFLLVAVTGATLAFTYLGINPPADVSLPEPKPVARTFEWMLPVGIVIGLFAVFVAAQLTVMFGGHAYLARTTGITYAEYVHQGFAQLCAATVLTLGVVGAAAAKARRANPRDRLTLRLALGVLCALALVVVASALYRMHVYEEAYGFTRLRLLVSVFEGWLGLVFLLVLVAGVRMRAAWLPMATVVAAALALLGLAWLNPDAYIASHNIARFHEIGKLDTTYLAGLSADAVPQLAGLPGDLAACARGDAGQDDWLAWNLGRSRAAQVQLRVTGCGD